METILAALAALAAGFGAGYILKKSVGGQKAEQLTVEAERLASQIKKEAETVRKEAELNAREIVLKANTESEEKIRSCKREAEEFEKRLFNREKQLDKMADQVERREQSTVAKEKNVIALEGELDAKKEELSRTMAGQMEKLQIISGMTPDDAKNELKDRMLKDARSEAVPTIRKIEENTKNEAEAKANRIISLAIQRCATDNVAENTVSVVDLPNEEMKGRIIGREGRNIRALEVATGVDLIIDDTPNAVIVSCFDPVKREVARQTLQRLINDGRIHPGRIEDTVEKVTKEVNTEMREEGEKAVFELGLDGIHPEIVKLLGRLKFRTSYSQNVLRHSIEVGFLAGVMASELKQNVKLARRAGLLHDIGKAVDQTMEGSHVQIGMDIAQRYNEHKVVLNSIGAHHEDEPSQSVIADLVTAADALSASRPGARREMLQNYINRMKKLEEIGDSFDGVERTYAIQAGREVRVVVEPEAIHDNEAFFLAKDIARKIEGELVYPGEIKVTVIRETRITDFAK